MTRKEVAAYGSRCEDCWAVGAQQSSDSGAVPMHDRVLMNLFHGYDSTLHGPWGWRGRVYRKSV